MKKEIPNFSNYVVDEAGDIYSRFVTKRDKRGRFYRITGTELKKLRTSFTAYGYIKLAMTDDDGKVFYKKPHRLVAEAFIENPENKKEVNHIDGNKENNCLGNLEWATRKENAMHAGKNKLFKPVRGSANNRAKLDEIKVLTARTCTTSNAELARLWGCSAAIISYARHGKTWKHVPMK